MADNEKRVSTGVAQEIPLDPLPPIQHQHNVASDSSSEFDEVSLVTLPCFALLASFGHEPTADQLD